MKTLEQCQWCRSSVFIVNCEHISEFVLIVDFEQEKVRWVHIEKTNTFEDKIGLCCSILILTSLGFFNIKLPGGGKRLIINPEPVKP